jgi:hypothetical protein
MRSTGMDVVVVPPGGVAVLDDHGNYELATSEA